MKRLLTTYLILSCGFLFAQKVELTVQTGHSSAITEVAFSPFDDFVASAGKDHKIVIWDFQTSKQYRVLLGHTKEITAFSFHPDNELLVSSSLDSTFRIWNYLSGALVLEKKLDFPVRDIKFNASGDKIVLAGDDLRIYDYPELKCEILGVKAKNYFSTIEISDNDSLLIAGGSQEFVGYLFDLKSKELRKKFTHPIISASFSEMDNSVLFSTNVGIAISYNYKTDKKKSKSTDWMLNTINDVAVDSNYVYLADDYGNVRVLQKRKWYQMNVLKGKFFKINSMEISHDDRYLAVGGQARSVVIWDLKKLRVVKVMRGLVNQINDIQFSENGRQILIAYEDGSMRKTDLVSNQTVVNKLRLNSEIMTKVGTFAVSRIIDFQETYATLEVIYKQAHLDHEGVYDRLEEYEVIWTFEENYIELNKKQSLSASSRNYIADLKLGIHHENTYFQDVFSDTDHSDSLNQNASIDGSKVLIENLSDNTKLSFEGQHSDRLTVVEYNDKYGFLATASWDGMIRFWDVKTGELMTVFGAFGDGQFVYVNPDGYYFSSKNALNYIGFSLENKIFSFEQFDLKYNRPDMVIKDLPYFDMFYEEAFERAYRKRLEKLGITEAEIKVSKDIPKIEVTNDLNFALVGNELKLQLKCSDEQMDLARLRVLVNGVPEYGRFGKEISGRAYEEEMNITLNPETNIIQLYVTNENNTSSLKKTLKFEAPASTKKSKLFLLSIGVSNYKESNYNLNYASKDAQDMAMMLPMLTRHKVEKRLLMVDSLVTKQSILDAKYFMAEAGVDDIVVMFVAGHGVLDDSLDYYFAPYDMDFAVPSKNGIPFSAFDDILEGTKSRKKLMLIDACHSGEIDKDEVIQTFVTDDAENSGDLIFRGAGATIANLDNINSFELSKALFADMRLNNGATVISSSGGAEYAIEGDEWNNGVFTYTLLQGLVTKAADKNNDKRVTISELQKYVQEGVRIKTAGRQTPTSRVENLNYDFIISKKWSD